MISRSVLVRFVFFWRYKTRPVRTTCRLWTFRTIWLLCLTWAIALMARSLILGWQSTMSATYIRSGVNGHFPELFLLGFEPIEVYYHHVRSNFTSRDTRALAQYCTVVGPTKKDSNICTAQTQTNAKTYKRSPRRQSRAD